MLTLQPNNIVEPFNHQRKGHANEYKVSKYPQRVLATATAWLRRVVVIAMPDSNHQSFNLNIRHQCLCIIVFIYGQY